jgi:hypothetical protein
VHRGFVAAGVAHVTALPRVTLRGDAAEAVGYSFVVLREDDGWFVHRAAINHWQLVRTPLGWRVSERANRVLDGTAGSRELMGRLAGGSPAGAPVAP